jgi:hypothetical protein
MRSLFNYTIPFAVIVPVLAAGGVSAGERCKFSYEPPKGEATYPQQLSMDVGDVPGHKIRAFEIHHSNPSVTLPCDNVKVVERWSHGFGDVIDRNGRSWGYNVDMLDSGDKIYSVWSGTVQTEVGADGASKTTYEGTTTWMGGTGRFASVRGIERNHNQIEYVVNADGKQEVKTNWGKAEGEYWFEK